MNGLPQALGMLRNGGWICPMEDRIVLMYQNFQIIKDLGTPLDSDSPFLLGDGTVGPDGYFYFGIYHPDDLKNKGGSVYRLTKDFLFEKVIDKMALPNGMAFSRDGKHYYLTEMFANCIWKFDYSMIDGSFTNKKLFTEIPETDGYPDGLILDGEGGVWSAHWQGFRVTRYNPDGSVDIKIQIPVPTATCMAFDDTGNLYITSASKGNSDEQNNQYKDSGNLFIVKTNHTGIPERLFLY